MSYIQKAKQNTINAEKAQAFDALQQQQRSQQIYKAGATDAYTEVEQALMNRMQQEAMQQRLYQAAENQRFVNQDVRGPAVTPVLPPPTEAPIQETGLAATVQQNMRDSAYSSALSKAQQDGNMSEDYINQLVEQELLQRGGL